MPRYEYPRQALDELTERVEILEKRIPGEKGPQGIPGEKGTAGEKGEKGETGTAGLGVPAGGEENAALAKKTAADNDTIWTKITDAMVAAGAAIADSKLALTTVVKLTGDQIIEGKKVFENFVTINQTLTVAVIQGLELLKIEGIPGIVINRRFQILRQSFEIGAGASPISAENCYTLIKPTAEGAELTRVQFLGAAPKTGELLFIRNPTANKLTIVHETAEAGTGKFFLLAGVNFVMPPKSTKMFFYDERWRDFS